MTTANKIKNALKGKNLTFVNVEKVLKHLGYSVVLFNTPVGDMEIQRYNLEHEKNTTKAFTYSQTAHIVFINGALHSDDRLYLALHELGHIVLGHIGDGKLITRNPILIDIEADNFAHSIIYSKKDKSMYILIALFILCFSVLINIGIARTPLIPVSLPENIEQQKHMAETVYVTPSGSKFHRKGCVYIKGRELTELQLDEAIKNYQPCKVCNP